MPLFLFCCLFDVDFVWLIWLVGIRDILLLVVVCCFLVVVAGLLRLIVVSCLGLLFVGYCMAFNSVAINYYFLIGLGYFACLFGFIWF